MRTFEIQIQKSQRRCLIVLIHICLVLGAYEITYAQALNSNPKITPQDDRFSAVDALASPRNWSISESNTKSIMVGNNRKTESSFDLPDVDYDSLTLYNLDGSVWYEFSLLWNSESPQNFLRHPKPGFIPFAPVGEWGQNVILRMVRESENWYEVEINEKTRERKYISRGDPRWTKTTWAFWLQKEPGFEITAEQSVLLTEIDGAVNEATLGKNFGSVSLLLVEGDWAFVVGLSQDGRTKYHGWLKWKDGREILVGTYFHIYLPLALRERWRLPKALIDQL